jgi:NTP pyrophosphatase (non-canonical NTP hydrolase)
VAEAYRVRNHAQGRPPWTLDNYMSGFVGDVGDLSKLIMARSGYRNSDNLEERLEHELADCLWSILIIADELGVDIEATYRRSMEDLLRRIGVE